MNGSWPKLIGFLVVGALLIGAGYGLASIRRSAQPAPIEIIPPEPSTAPFPTAEFLPDPTIAPLRVYVSGAVVNPAVYSLPAGSIIDDAVRAAGGFLPDADPVAVNLAQSLSDGMQIYVPALGETGPPPVINELAPAVPDSSRMGGITVQGLININSATQRELEMLPGIGPATAEHIVAYREANGPFTVIEAIMDVPGIGEAKFAAIKDLITTEP